MGEVHVVEGTIMASVDTFEITITGKGGHGAMPHETVDPIMIQGEHGEGEGEGGKGEREIERWSKF